MYGSIAEALMQPKRYRWFTGTVVAPYLPWTFASSAAGQRQPVSGAPAGGKDISLGNHRGMQLKTLVVKGTLLPNGNWHYKLCVAERCKGKECT